MAERWDVVVVGAGPAGAATAMLLAREGFRVMLVDRQHFPRPKACAEYLSPGVRAVLRRMGLENAIADAQPVPGMDIVSPKGRRLRVTYGRDGRPEFAATLPRTILDEAIVRQATAEGAVLREGCVVRAVRRREGRVEGLAAMSGNRRVEIDARLTIVADGSRSVLARSLGVARNTRWPLRMGLVAHMDGVNLREGFGQMHVARDGYCGLAPLPGGHANVAVVVPLSAVAQSGMSAPAFFHAWLRAHAGVEAIVGQGRLLSSIRGVAPIGSRAHRSWVPGALLVGDAAGFFDPFTGEGIFRALRGAEMASMVATAALAAGNVDTGLSRYSTLRREAFRGKSGVTTLVQLFVQRPSLLEYAVPRLNNRPRPLRTLCNVLGDIEDPARFLHPQMLWSALRP